MLERKNVLVLAIIVALASLTPPYLVHPAHAATGEVCLADPTTSIGSTTPCPATPAVFDGPPGQEIRIGVFIQGSDYLNGFDIVLLADHTFLEPVGVDLTGTVLLGSYTPVLECLSGVLISGTVCSGIDTFDTLHLAEVSGIGTGLTAYPTTGLLFTAIYNITGTNSGENPVSVGFQTGCRPSTSISGGVCVTIPNGSVTPNSETSQSARFDNSAAATLPYVALSASPTSLGPQFPSVTSIATITATAENGFPGFGADSVTFTDTAPPGLTATIEGANPCATLATSCSVTTALSSNAAGNYSVTVFGIYSTLDANGNSETLVSIARINLAVWDFGFNLGSSSISLISGTTGHDQAVLTSQNGFGGSITLSAASSFPPGLTTSSAPATVVLQAGTSATSTISFSAPQNATGIYRVQIRAVSGSRIKTAACTITVTAGGLPDFSLSSNPPDLILSPNGSDTSTISVTSINGFSNLVSLAITGPPGLTASIFPQSITGSGNATLTVSSTIAGNYTARVIGTSGTISHNVALAIAVTSTPVGKVCLVPSGASSCPLSPAPITANVGEQVRVSVLIQNSASFAGFDITLLSDHTVLLPVGVDLTGTVLLGSYYPVLECLSGVLISGTFCSGGDTFDTLHLAEVSGIGTGLTASPTTGLLFTAIYNVTATTSGTDLGFQTCGSSNSPPLCVDIFDGLSVTPIRETDSIAVFSTSTSPDFALTSDPSALTIATGSRAASTVFLTSFNGFNGNVTLSTSIFPSTGLTCTLNSTTITTVSETSTLLCGGTGGVYRVTVIGTSGTLSHSTTIVSVPFFAESANPSIVSVDAGRVGASTITLAPFYGFIGLVNLSTAVTPSPGLDCSLNKAVVYVDNPVSLNLSCSGTAGVYTVTVEGRAGTLSSSAIVTVIVQDFGVSATPSSISVAQGYSAAGTVNVTSVEGFSGMVTLTASYSPSLQVTLNSSTVKASGSSILTITATSTALGTYLVNVTGTSEGLSHTTTVTVTVAATSPRVLPPILVQTTRAHRLSLSKTNGVQTWELGINNPNHKATLYASLRIVGTDSLNTTRFTINTPVYKLSPDQSIINLQEDQTFTTAQVGTRFTITITIQWGLTPTTMASGLPFTSTSTRTGTFNIQS